MLQHVYNCVLEWRIILPLTLILPTTLPSFPSSTKDKDQPWVCPNPVVEECRRDFKFGQKDSHNKKIHQRKVVVTAGNGIKVTFVRRADLTFYCEPCKMALIGGANSVHQHADNCEFLRCVQGRGERGRSKRRERGRKGRMKLLYLRENIFVPAVEGKTGGMEGGEDGGRGKWEKFLAIKSSPLAGSEEGVRRAGGAAERARN